MKKISFLFLVLSSVFVFAQKTSITYESNGKKVSLESNNPFVKFFGEWTLKNNDWSQNWGYGTEHIKIPKHHTVSAGINTKNSLLSIIDGPEPNGQIYWSYNPNTKQVDHLSSFGDIRAGRGKGTIDKNGNLRLKLFFEGEPKGTYRVYTYTWVNNNEYVLKSVQFDQNDKPTGLFYGGNFIRIQKNDEIQEITQILKTLDNNKITIDKQLSVYADTIVHMAPNNNAITNKDDLKSYLEEQRSYGLSKMTHKVIDYEVINETVIMLGEVVGTFYSKNEGNPVKFRTKNMFVFKRIQGKLKISKIIYNMSPVQQN